MLFQFSKGSRPTILTAAIAIWLCYRLLLYNLEKKVQGFLLIVGHGSLYYCLHNEVMDTTTMSSHSELDSGHTQKLISDFPESLKIKNFLCYPRNVSFLVYALQI